MATPIWKTTKITLRGRPGDVSRVAKEVLTNSQKVERRLRSVERRVASLESIIVVSGIVAVFGMVVWILSRTLQWAIG